MRGTGQVDSGCGVPSQEVVGGNRPHLACVSYFDRKPANARNDCAIGRLFAKGGTLGAETPSTRQIGYHSLGRVDSGISERV